jgi:sugar phosphate isomerase/epimerase
MERRKFLQTTSLVTAGLLLHGSLSSLAGCSFKGTGKHVKKFGLQLYTLRDVIGKDPKGILKQVASFGYNQIESYEHEKLGLFMGMTPKEFRKYLADLDMDPVSGHSDIGHNWEKKVEDAKEAGMKYLIKPSFDPHSKLDDFKKAADAFNKAGEVCKKSGLKFAYHNHDFEYTPINGTIPQDILMQNTDPELVDFEMDIYWVVTAGQDPIAWFNKYPGRYKFCHVKDRKKGAHPRNTDASVILGTGQINFPVILKAGKEKGLKYLIVEQEKYENSDPLSAVKANAEYMKSLELV